MIRIGKNEKDECYCLDELPHSADGPREADFPKVKEFTEKILREYKKTVIG